MSAATATTATTSYLARQLRERDMLARSEQVALAILLCVTAAVYVLTPLWVFLPLDGTRAAPAAPIRLLAAILAGLATLLLGLWVYRYRRQSPTGRLFLLFTSALALALITSYGLWAGGWMRTVWSAALPLAAGLLVTFGMIFPVESAAAARQPAQRWLPVAGALAASLLIQLATPSDPQARQMALHLLAAALGGVFVAGQVTRSFGALSPVWREQSRLLVGGALAGFAPYVAAALTPLPIPMAWGIAAVPLFPAVVAFTITQSGSIDSSRLTATALSYSLMAAAVTGGYALIVTGVNLVAGAFFAQRVPATHPGLLGLIAFTLAVGFNPLRERLNGAVAARFQLSRSEHQSRLTAFRHSLTLVSGLPEVVRLLKQQLREGIGPTHAYVFLRDPLTGDFVAAGDGSRPDTDIRFEGDSGLAHALSAKRDALFLELKRGLPPELAEDHARLAILRTPLLVPLLGQDRLAGWLAVGAKRAGEAFDMEDIRFVQGLAEQASLAVERAQVIADLEQRVRELDVLSQVAQAVNFTTDPDALLELVYAQASKLIDTTNFYIVLHHPGMQALRYAFFLEGGERRDSREREYWPDAEGLAAEVIRTGRPIRTTDYAAECARRGISAPRRNRGAWMGVPLNAGNQTLGAMAVANFAPGAVFTEDQLKVFWAIADQAATALEKARLFSETETLANQLVTLNDLSKELSATLTLGDLPERILQAAMQIMDAEAGSLLMVDERSGELLFQAVEGGLPNLVGTRLPAGIGTAGEAVEHAMPVLANEASEGLRHSGGSAQSVLAVPILIAGEPAGVIEVVNRQDGAPYDEGDATLLTTFAAQAAVAIQNARLYEATDAELARRVEELQNLQRIDAELNRTLELDRVTGITLAWATRLTHASAGLIALAGEQGGALAIAGLKGGAHGAATLPPLDASTGLIGQVMQTGEPLRLVADAAADAALDDLLTDHPAVRLVVPVLRAERPVGVLVLDGAGDDDLNQQDFDFVLRLVEHAAVTIENAQLVEQVRDANRSKTEFISFVAHELKNPMTSIRGYTDLIKSGAVGETSDMQQQFLGTIRSNVDRMTRLVSDLADTARIETDNLRLDLEATSVHGVVEETLRGLQGQIEEKNQQLTIDLADALPALHADHTRMVQVLTNLVSNAHKYTPDGGQIVVGARAETVTDSDTGEACDVVHHWVQDTGIGMDEADQRNLFTKFFRTERGKDMAQGTGLGLTISKNLVERHGGAMWVESAVGEGSTFHYTIPAHRGDTP